MLKVANDLEVADILSESPEKCSTLHDNKPLSPILSSNNFSRKFLSHKRATSVCRLDRLEEIEENRKSVYKLIVGRAKTDFCFKMPMSPAPNRIKKNCRISRKEIPQNINHFDDIAEIPEGSVFKTATGKQLSIPEHVIKKHEKMFDDILSSRSQIEEQRINKYSYMSKTFLSNTSYPDEINLKYSCKRKSESQVHSDKSKSDMQIIVNGSETNTSQIEKTISLTQEISSSGISDTQISFAMDNALDGMQNKCCNTNWPNFEREFRGFTQKEIDKSNSLHDNLLKTQDLFYFNEYKEKILSDKQLFSASSEYFHSPPKKRLKLQSVSCTTKDTVQQMLKRKEKVSSLQRNFPFNGISTGGFVSASGKPIEISPSTLNSAKNMFDNINPELCENKIKDKSHFFGSESGSKNDFSNYVKIKEMDFEKNNCYGNDNINTIVEKETLSNNSDQKNVQVISGSHRLKSEGMVKSKKYNTVKDKMKFFDAMIESKGDFIPKGNCSMPMNRTLGFFSASGNSLETSDIFLEVGKRIFADIDETKKDESEILKTSQLTAQMDAKNKLKYLEEAIKMAESKCIYNGNEDFFRGKEQSFSMSDADIHVSRTYFDKMNSDSNNLENLLPDEHHKVVNCRRDVSGVAPRGMISNFDTNCINVNRQLLKKKLGMTPCKQIVISEMKLEKAKQLFQDEFPQMSPIRPVQQNILHTSTPLKKSYCITPIQKNNLRFTNSNLLDFDKTSETPIVKAMQREVILFKDNLSVTLDEPVVENSSDLRKDLKDELGRLEKRLQAITKRQEALALLEEEKSVMYRKPRIGVLFQAKLKSARVPLNLFVERRIPGETFVNDLFDISPQNARNVHFKESDPKSTKDGAIVIPNSKDLIGLREIEYALKNMPGVEQRLIPKGWIENHYKWIIWKLASYERMFPMHFPGSLSIEHVIQQLKYRYDREIDKTERSPLKKIYEKDDIPQKRMVLCVSDIKKVDSNKFELQLTDGWYEIRTVLDDPLCKQIPRGKIKIGTKLLTSGAELMNCDGCIPLEATDLVYLKINFNCTRRAVWNARLGYQRFPGPFPIQIHSVHPMGGPVGAIQITIVRVYPVKYLEKVDGLSVWRNKRAEERKSQECELEKWKKIEQIEADLKKELNGCDKRITLNCKKADISTDISTINCPEILLDIMESSNDPDTLQEKMSPHQRSGIMEYKRNLYLQKQQEISFRVYKNVDKLQKTERDVVPVLKMLVVDINGSPTRAFSFTIWSPTESHIDILKEGSSVTAYNVLPKMNGDLNCGSKTFFKSKSPKEQISEIFKRKVIGIRELSDYKFSVNFNEFDTVGLVIQIKIHMKFQEIWLADMSGRIPELIGKIDTMQKELACLKNQPFRFSEEEIINEINERQTRAKNVMVYNMPESPQKPDIEVVLQLVQDICGSNLKIIKTI
ncbi:hypothetical protein JTB14_008937 [Gonioctena quinquepunctata]|nr:hypothetical protein JTB14_008937 [Gonioctena quinquepunctata]